ncbi:GGDEF domain-containing protein [Qipengyuania sp. DGS5-3]|uniref:GGDEF domain-containing protein n=1 Tax=Qipengyuania sp. DGS5-3 TaxID=3349632 RepID=UPI0036D2DAB6
MRGISFSVALLAAALLCLFAQAPAAAKDAQRADCVTSLAAALSVTEIVSNRHLMLCQKNALNIAQPQTVLRFDLANPGQRSARFLQTRLGHFAKLTIAIVDADGEVEVRNYDEASVRLTSGRPAFLAELPPTSENAQALFVIFDEPRHDATLLQAELLDSDPTLSSDHSALMFGFAILVGLMLSPLLFDLAFWTALKQNFLIWHAALSLSFAALVFFRSGLAVEFLDLSIASWRATLVIALGVAGLMASLFTQSFVEQDKLHPALRKALPFMGLWCFAASVIHAARFDFLAPLGGTFHTLAMIPVLGLFIMVLVDAWRRGSRAIRFQMAGWIPLIFAFSIQIVSFLTPWGIPTDALPLFYIGVVSETAITAIGVADRFIALRRERDNARLIANEMGTLSVRDPMTGLMNRRGLDNRFEELQAQGFNTFALLDLDEFKKINDRFGHAIGDDVLVATGAALNSEPGRDTVAFRMGGEEFLLLLRGPKGLERIENLRTAISRRVASDVAGLESVVTASMGVIISPADAYVRMTLDDLYKRADTLLYEAKAAGRNRSVHERLTLFSDRGEGVSAKAEAASARAA